MSIKSKLFKGLAVVSLLLPIAFSANSNNVNASAKKHILLKLLSIIIVINLLQQLNVGYQFYYK
ncbi:hypothetical protein DY124_04835 [Apilactobacillus micheneri]|nr:hypothetical protein DY124_04835 [Apilactobacillus micheneri]TPR47694.1 hypothetical protein DY125_04835 [Apilactobacillus micheneri]